MPQGLTYDELKDHPIQETYKQWARQWWADPSSTPDFMQTGLNAAFQDPSLAFNMLLEDPEVAAMLQSGTDAQRAAQEAYRNAIGAQRAAAAKQRAIERKRLEFRLDTGLRDIEQGREAGLESMVNNALQRGIYNSGIRIENEQEVNRESDEAAGDLRTQIDLALQSLAAQAAAQNAQYGAQDAQLAAQDAAQGLTINDLAALASSDFYTSQFQPPAVPPATVPQPPTNLPQAPTGAAREPALESVVFKQPPPSPWVQMPAPKVQSPIQPVGRSPY